MPPQNAGPKGTSGYSGDKGKPSGNGNAGDRDDGKRAGVGTGGGAHSPQGNQKGKDAHGKPGLGPDVPRGSKEMTAKANQELAKKHGISDAEASLARDLAQASAMDDADIGNDIGDDIGNFIGGLFGWGETAQTADDIAGQMASNIANGQPAVSNDVSAFAMDQLDIGTLVTGLAGIATGLPIGSAYSIGKSLTGFDGFNVDLGAGFFEGGSTSSTSSSRSSGSNSTSSKSSNESSKSTSGMDNDRNNNKGEGASFNGTFGNQMQTQSSSNSNSSGDKDGKDKEGESSIQSLIDELMSAQLTVQPFVRPAPYTINTAPHEAIMEMIASARSR